MSCVGCSPTNNQIKQIEYVYPQFEIPKSPSYYDVEWERFGDLYCVDERNAKALLKNVYLMRTYIDELLEILYQLRREGRHGKAD